LFAASDEQSRFTLFRRYLAKDVRQAVHFGRQWWRYFRERPETENVKDGHV